MGARSRRWASPGDDDDDDEDRSRSTDRGGSREPRVPLFAQPAQLLPWQRRLPLRPAAAAAGGA
eukprot:3934956-Pyramimonas_sp.AAC.1